MADKFTVVAVEMNSIGEIVKQHRRVSGLSRVALAKIAGVGKTVIFDLEHQKVSIQYDTLLKILDALNIKIQFDSPLLQRTGHESPPRREASK